MLDMHFALRVFVRQFFDPGVDARKHLVEARSHGLEVGAKAVYPFERLAQRLAE